MKSARTYRFPWRRLLVPGLALAGLTAVLGVLLQGAWQAKTQAVERNLRTAVALAAQDLETSEISDNAAGVIARFGNEHVAHSPAQAWIDVRSLEPRFNVATDSLRVVKMFRPPPVRRVGSVGVTSTVDTLATDSYTFVLEHERTELIEHVVGQLLYTSPRPLAERLSPARIDSVLGARLAEVSIRTRPGFTVVRQGDGEPELTGGAPLASAPGALQARARLFPLDVAPPFYDLVVDLGQAHGEVLRQVWPLWAASALFLLVTAGAFARAASTIADQQRQAAHLTAFINNMTHEFKTPLATVSLACEALTRDGEPDDRRGRYLAMIRQENERLGRQVEHVLQMSRLERGEFTRGGAVVEMGEVLARAAEVFGLRATAAGGTLDYRAPAAPAPVRGDDVQLASVVDNLLDNAVKYADGPPRITLTGEVAGGALRIVVRDHGPGIPRAHRDRVFEPYYRVPTGDRHDVKGFGLGLGFVRTIAELHGGQARLDETPGGGATVTVALPLEPENPEDATA